MKKKLGWISIKKAGHAVAQIKSNVHTRLICSTSYEGKRPNAAACLDF